MQFTLVYQGDLPPNGDAKEKWRIRRALEPQLRRLWTVPPFADIAEYTDPNYQPDTCYVGQKIKGKGVEYIPCISTKLEMRAELNIHLLSASMPGGLVKCGDIDNRLKTLLDALSIPDHQQAINDPELEEDGRMYCLLEDDKLVTRLEITNDRLLTVDEYSREAIVVIKVHPVASRGIMANLAISI